MLSMTICSSPTPLRPNLRVRRLPRTTLTSWIVWWKIRTSEEGRDERRTSNADNEIEGKFARGDDHGENRLEANMNEEVIWTLAEENEDIQDDVAWNENAAVFEQKDPLDTVLALDADDAAPNDEAVKEAVTAVSEGEAVDFPEVDFDRKDEATLRDVVTEEVLVPAVGAPHTGWHVDRFPQGRAGCAL